MIGKFGTTMINGLFCVVVDEGTVIEDPSGKAPAVTVTGGTCAVVGHKLYCTNETEKKLAARIDAMREARAANG